MEQVTVGDGKYTLINDNGKLSALRNGEPWDRDLIGDNLVYWMMVEIINLNAQLAKNEPSITTPLSSWGTLIRAIRTVYTIPLRQMAASIGMTPADMSKMELGEAPVSEETVESVFHFLHSLGVPVSISLLKHAAGG